MNLDAEAKRPIDELVLCADVAFLHPPNLSLPDRVHRLVTLNRPPRTTELTKVLLSHGSLANKMPFLVAGFSRFAALCPSMADIG